MKDLDEQSVGKDHTATIIIGYIFLIFGYIAFVLPSPIPAATQTQQKCVSTALVNTLIALGSGLFFI